MVLSKGLVISLGFSALSCTLLFLYFRNKMTTMERKVNVMFDIVQNYQPAQEYSPQTNQTYDSVHENQEHQQDNQNNENTGAWNLNAQDDRIVISDDSDDDDDSEEVSDSDSEDESEEIPKLSLAKTDNISLTENDIKKISVKETPVIDDTIELEEVDSLDEIDDDDDDDDDDDNNSETETPDINIKKISVTKNDTEENNDKDDNNDVEEESEDNDEVDYTQLKVSELKAIAEAKGF